MGRWMSSNRLKLNPSKTELNRFYSDRRQLSFVENDIELFGNRIAPVHTVRDLGIMLDSNMFILYSLSMSCEFARTVIPKLGWSVDWVESKLLCVHALVQVGWITVEVFLNALTLVSCPAVTMQSVLNSVARLIFGLKRFDHITPALTDWHWLTYKLCIKFKFFPGEAASSPQRGPRVNAQMMTSLPSPFTLSSLPLIDRVCVAKACPGRDTNSLLRLCECWPGYWYRFR